MKKQLTMIVLSLIITSTAIACPSEGRAEKRKEKMAQKLNLNAEQQEEFELIMQEKRASMKAARLEIDVETKEKLALVLSAEQLQMVEERAEKHDKKRRHKKRK